MIALRVSMVFFLVGATLAISSEPGHATNFVWSEFRQIATLDDKGEVVTFSLDGAKILTTGTCQNSFRIDPNDPAAAQKKAMLASAKTRNKPISVRFPDDATKCPIGVMAIKVGP